MKKITVFSNVKTVFKSEEEERIISLNNDVVICGGIFVEFCTIEEVSEIYITIKSIKTISECKNFETIILLSSRDLYIICKILQICYKIKSSRSLYKDIFNLIDEVEEKTKILYNDETPDIDSIEDLKTVEKEKVLSTLRKYMDSYNSIYCIEKYNPDLNSVDVNYVSFRQYFISFINRQTMDSEFDSNVDLFFPKNKNTNKTLYYSVVELFIKKRENLEYILQNSKISHETDKYFFCTDSDISFSNNVFKSSIKSFFSSKTINQKILKYINSYRKYTPDSKKIVVMGDSLSKSCCPFFDEMGTTKVLNLNTSLGRIPNKFYGTKCLLDTSDEYSISTSYSDACFSLLVMDYVDDVIKIYGTLPFDSDYESAILDYKMISKENNRVKISQDDYFTPSKNYNFLFSFSDSNVHFWLCKDKYKERYLIINSKGDKIPNIKDKHVEQSTIYDSDDNVYISSPKSPRSRSLKEDIDSGSEKSNSEFQVDIDGDYKVDVLNDSDSISRSKILDEESITSRATTLTLREKNINEILNMSIFV